MKNINKKSISISGICLILLTVLFAFSQAQAQAQTVAYKRPTALPANSGLSPVLRLNYSADFFNTSPVVFSAFADLSQSDGSIVVNTLTDTDDGICDAADCSLREAINYANSDGVNSIITFSVSGTIRLTSLLPAVADNGTLSITGSQAGITISGDANNSAVNDGGDVRIFSVIAGADVTFNNLTLTGGRASGLSSEGQDKGGAINNLGTLTVSNCKLMSNFAGNFGGAINNLGAVTVTGSTLDNNSTRSVGGAINNEGGTLTVIGSTLTNNSTAIYGGAIRNFEESTATVVNSTLVGNSVEYSEFGVPQAIGEGGAIYNAGTLTVSSSTLVGNRAALNGGTIYNSQSVTFPVSPTIKNNLFISMDRDAFYGLPTNPNSGGDANKNYAFGNQSQAGLGALADNGGPTQTMALLEGSQVINKGDATDAPQFDQRGAGFSRVQQGALDVGAFEVQNNAPTDLALSNATMPDKTASGSTVGTFSTTDQLPDSHTYSLVSGTGDGDNASFVIEGNTLKTAVTFDYATKSSYSIRVQTLDSGGLTFQKNFIISVSNVNDAPTDITLSNAAVNENLPGGTTVGSFSTTDANVGNTHTYSLVSGTGDGDNASFVIEGNTLKTAATFDFETRSSYSIRVQTRDGGGLTFQKAFTINVGNVYDEPPSLVVTTLADVVAEDGVTSLREAINYANSDGVDSAISFAVSGTISLGSTLPAFANNGTLSITGPQAGITISGKLDAVYGVNNILIVSTGANVTLDKLDLRDGKGRIEDYFGGGGAINNSGTLKVSNCTLANNFARFGGAIRNTGALTVTGSKLENNTAYVDGGAIYNNGTLSTLTVTGSTLESNSAGQYGGAINNSGTLTVTGSTLWRNGAGQNGGAIYNYRTLTMTNSTLEGNSAIEYGGAIYNYRTLTMTNSTLADNYAEYNGSAIHNEAGGITWKNNLFAQNTGGGGAVSSLTDPTSSGDANKNYSFDSLGDAGLSGLDNNGGPTATMALSPTSPVVDKGLDTTLAPDSLSTDQRGTGYARKSGSAVDIGAFEVQTVSSAPADLTIAKSHAGNFTQGDTGKTYSITVSNSGSGSTSETVSVTDTLPSGLTATAITGSGWSCNLAALTCTRSDALAAVGSYPAITVTVDVANNAPASVTNTATVSGGGETDTSNNTATDPTTINAAANNSISGQVIYGKTPSGSAARGVPDVVVDASGTPSATATSNLSGIYQLSGLGSGAYTVTPSKSGDVNRITATDALLVQQYSAYAANLTANQLIAADTNNDNQVNITDSLYIQQYLAYVNTATANFIGQWKFLPGSQNYTLSGSLTNQNYTAVLVGEVDGDWVAPGGTNAPLQAASMTSESEDAAGIDIETNANQTNANDITVNQLGTKKPRQGEESIKHSPPAAETATAAAAVSSVTVSLPANASASTGTSVTIPINVSQLPALTDANVVRTYAFNVQYDATVLQYTGYDTTGTLSANGGTAVCGQPPADPTTVNRIVACNYVNINGITGAGTLLKLNFTVIGTSGQTSALMFVGTARQPDTFIFNTGRSAGGDQ